MQGTFKRENNLEKRKELCKRLTATYSNRVPVIVEIASKTTLQLKKRKFLVPNDISMGAFLNEIRKQATINAAEAIFIFCGTVLVPTHSTLDQIHSKYKDEDGFLYLTVALENTFGGMYYAEFIADSIINKILNAGETISRTLNLTAYF